MEPGETPQVALVRELEEELGIRARDFTEIARYQYTYSGRNPIELIFFRIDACEGEPRNIIFQDLRWEPKQSLAGFDFVEGDREFLQALYTGAYGD